MVSPDAPRFGMVAGEASGDLLGAELLGGLQRRWPKLHSFGIGGPRMAANGFDAWWPHHKLAVHGYADALSHLPELLGMRRQLLRRLLRDRPSAFIGIDAPDFNLALEARLKAAGVKSIHFVCPSIWAWRGGRVKRLARSVDHVLCLLPFEPELLRQAGVAASYVGHPLADIIPLQPPREAARAALGLGANDTVVALLPGSRLGEIRHIAPPFLQAAVLLQRRRPELRFVLPTVDSVRDAVGAALREHAPRLPVQLLSGQSHAALAACDITLIASGTATLEAALFKRPMVIGYRVNALSYQLMRHMRYQPWVGLPNILLREFIVPELLQDQCNPMALADAVLTQLDDAQGGQRLAERFIELHLLLKRDTARCASDAIAQILQA